MECSYVSTLQISCLLEMLSGLWEDSGTLDHTHEEVLPAHMFAVYSVVNTRVS